MERYSGQIELKSYFSEKHNGMKKSLHHFEIVKIEVKYVLHSALKIFLGHFLYTISDTC